MSTITISGHPLKAPTLPGVLLVCLISGLLVAIDNIIMGSPSIMHDSPAIFDYSLFFAFFTGGLLYLMNVQIFRGLAASCLVFFTTIAGSTIGLMIEKMFA